MATVQLPSVQDIDLHTPRHPRTGELLVPIYTRKDGTHLWPILGASDDAPGPDDLDDPNNPEDDDADDDTGDDDSSDDDDDSDDDDKKSKSKKKKDDDEDSVEKWRYDKLERRMKAADRRAATAETEVKELKTQLAGKVDPKDVDKTTAEENAKLKPQVTKLTETNKRLTLEVAFLTTNDIKWRDPEAALRLADLSEVDIDEETGKVDTRALKAALRQLAKDKKYLVNDDKQTDDDDEDDSSDGPPKMNRRRGQKKAPDRKVLAKRFPALGNL